MKGGKSRLSEKSRQWIMLIAVVLNISLFLFSVYTIFTRRSQPNNIPNRATEVFIHSPEIIPSTDKNTQSDNHVMDPTLKIRSENVVEDIKSLPECTDDVWCSIPMPSVSYFKFDPPTNEYRWRRAQIQASNREQVLLRKVMEVFPNHFDFIDGDITFRKLHYLFDVFVDERRDLSPLLPPSPSSPLIRTDSEVRLRKLLESTNFTKSAISRRLAEDVITAPKMVRGQLMYPWEVQGRKVIPEPYDFRYADRAAVVSIGYTAYSRDSQTYFAGNRIGGAFIDRRLFFQHWRKVKDRFPAFFSFPSHCFLIV